MNFWVKVVYLAEVYTFGSAGFIEVIVDSGLLKPLQLQLAHYMFFQKYFGNVCLKQFLRCSYVC